MAPSAVISNKIIWSKSCLHLKHDTKLQNRSTGNTLNYLEAYCRCEILNSKVFSLIHSRIVNKSIFSSEFQESKTQPSDYCAPNVTAAAFKDIC